MTPKQPTGDELMPCPFCGGGANYMRVSENRHGVNCSNEFCIGYYLPDADEQCYYTKEYAYEAWNTRQALSDSTGADVATEVPLDKAGLRINYGRDGAWLPFKNSQGNMASISVSCLVENYSGSIKDTILQWAKDLKQLKDTP